MSDRTNYRVVQGAEIANLLGGYLVDTARLHDLVYGDGMPIDLSRLIWGRLHSRAIQESGTDSFLLGLELAAVAEAQPHWREQIEGLLGDCQNLDKLPLVTVLGRPVDSSRVAFVGTTPAEA